MIGSDDRAVLRGLAGRYAEIASLDVQKERLARYAATNELESGRPVVLIDEVPWGEIRDEALINVCSPELHWIEGEMRRALYQWEHFQVDMVIPPEFRVMKLMRSSGIGVAVEDTTIRCNTGATQGRTSNRTSMLTNSRQRTTLRSFASPRSAMTAMGRRRPVRSRVRCSTD